VSVPAPDVAAIVPGVSVGTAPVSVGTSGVEVAAARVPVGTSGVAVAAANVSVGRPDVAVASTGVSVGRPDVAVASTGVPVGATVVGFPEVGTLVGFSEVGRLVGSPEVGTLVGFSEVGTLVGFSEVGTLVGFTAVGAGGVSSTIALLMDARFKKETFWAVVGPQEKPNNKTEPVTEVVNPSVDQRRLTECWTLPFVPRGMLSVPMAEDAITVPTPIPGMGGLVAVTTIADELPEELESVQVICCWESLLHTTRPLSEAL